jgi:hypothetical protein
MRAHTDTSKSKGATMQFITAHSHQIPQPEKKIPLRPGPKCPYEKFQAGTSWGTASIDQESSKQSSHLEYSPSLNHFPIRARTSTLPHERDGYTHLLSVWPCSSEASPSLIKSSTTSEVKSIYCNQSLKPLIFSLQAPFFLAP